MFHPVWEEAGGGLSVAKGIREKPQACQLCDHSSVVHRLNGACYGPSCLCGWTKDMNGALHVKSSGQYVGDVGCLPKRDPSRRPNRGVKVAISKRMEILVEPCHFCGGKAQSIDHFVPRSKGGRSDRSNLVPACHLCNGIKGDKSYDELIVFCVKMETAVPIKMGLRRLATFYSWKAQARKILAWHEKRLVEKQLPVV